MYEIGRISALWFISSEIAIDVFHFFVLVNFLLSFLGDFDFSTIFISIYRGRALFGVLHVNIIRNVLYVIK